MRKASHATLRDALSRNTNGSNHTHDQQKLKISTGFAIARRAERGRIFDASIKNSSRVSFRNKDAAKTETPASVAEVSNARQRGANHQSSHCQRFVEFSSRDGIRVSVRVSSRSAISTKHDRQTVAHSQPPKRDAHATCFCHSDAVQSGRGIARRWRWTFEIKFDGYRRVAPLSFALAVVEGLGMLLGVQNK